MLEQLVKYAHENGLEAEPGFKPKQVRWAVNFTESGRLLDIVELGSAEERNNRGQWFDKCPDSSQSELIAQGKTRSHFLIDTASVVVLLDVDGEDNKTLTKHAYFIDLLRQAATAMPELLGVAEQLSSSASLDAIRRRFKELKAKGTDKVTFRAGDSYPLESAAWHDWWRGFRAQAGTSAPGDAGAEASQLDGQLMRCFATGELARAVPTHLKIEGLQPFGGQPSGDALVCFDKKAFRSYGLDQSANAAVGEEAMCAYRASLNHLIRESSGTVAGVCVVHWFKTKVEAGENPFSWLRESDAVQEASAQSRARELLESVRSGKRPDLAENHYYSLGLSGAGGRVMVRDWMDGQFGELVRNVLQWFDDLEMTDHDGVVRGAPHIERVITCLLPSRRRGQTYGDWTRSIGPERLTLWHVAVRGDRVPYGVLSRLVPLNIRLLVSGEPNANLLRIRMGLIRAYHNRKERGEGSMGSSVTPFLNEQHPSPAYHCGRLMAVLAEIQHQALGEVGANVVMRYYAGASATPALVLGRLVRTSHFHMDKIPRYRRQELDELMSGIWASLVADIPRTLNLEEQSLFAMGYYQQKAARVGRQAATNKSGDRPAPANDGKEE
jgi:CRISPR-associated protein Csd1